MMVCLVGKESSRKNLYCGAILYANFGGEKIELYSRCQGASFRSDVRRSLPLVAQTVWSPKDYTESELRKIIGGKIVK